jgi:hypothetical protein
VRIDVQEREIEKRQQQIDGRAIRLHDGRRAYVDGDGYADGQGRELTGADYDEAHRLHQQHPDAARSTDPNWYSWQEIMIRNDLTTSPDGTGRGV